MMYASLCFVVISFYPISETGTGGLDAGGALLGIRTVAACFWLGFDKIADAVKTLFVYRQPNTIAANIILKPLFVKISFPSPE